MRGGTVRLRRMWGHRSQATARSSSSGKALAGRRPQSRSVARCALIALLIGTVLIPGGRPSSVRAQAFPFDTASLGSGPYARTCTLLERTIFRVDVLTVDLRFGPETARRIRRLARADAARDTIARIAMRSRNAFARIEFVRDVGMDRFLDGIRRDLRRATDAGVIGRGTFHTISSSLPDWYDFLEERGVRDGDRLLYRVRGDTLHSGYRAADGDWLLQQTDVGPERRLSVLGSYLVEGSSFRKGLLDSLLGPVEEACPAGL